MLEGEESKCELCSLPYDTVRRSLEWSACGHTFCSLCLKDLLHDGELRCPACFETKVPLQLVRCNLPEANAMNFHDLSGSSQSLSLGSPTTLRQFREWCVQCSGFADGDCFTWNHEIVSLSSDGGKELVKFRARLIADKYHLKSAIEKRTEANKKLGQILSSFRSHGRKFEQVLAWNRIKLYKLTMLLKGLDREDNSLLTENQLHKRSSLASNPKLYSSNAAADLEEIEAIRKSLATIEFKLVDDDELPTFHEETAIGTRLCDSAVVMPKRNTTIQTKGMLL